MGHMGRLGEHGKYKTNENFGSPGEHGKSVRTWDVLGNMGSVGCM